MDRQEAQRKIDAIPWYHEFDFGDGLKAVPRTPDLEFHRTVWAFIEKNLDRIDFRGKTVLDVGCWDGYWSFYAERRGARRVLATDDASQNWAGSKGLLVARELLHSSIDVNLAVSAYDLVSLGQKFDIILFLGVYYHLHDPFYALAQLRHCCHPGSVLAIEGDELLARHSRSLTVIDFSDHSKPLFSPARNALQHMLRAAYFLPVAADPLSFEEELPAPPPPPPGRLGWRWRLKMSCQALLGCRTGALDLAMEIAPPVFEAHPLGRQFLACQPFEGANTAHLYRPPFGLHAYDVRFSEKNAA